mmetsp:Transcript_22538/g.45268  ORF Transcript_22538/g.45268 Transcript_22538/m.45268 type:complete len:208 (-) Transcript_22538:1097-1720(-)
MHTNLSLVRIVLVCVVLFGFSFTIAGFSFRLLIIALAYQKNRLANAVLELMLSLIKPPNEENVATLCTRGVLEVDAKLDGVLFLSLSQYLSHLLSSLQGHVHVINTQKTADFSATHLLQFDVRRWRHNRSQFVRGLFSALLLLFLPIQINVQLTLLLSIESPHHKAEWGVHDVVFEVEARQLLHVFLGFLVAPFDFRCMIHLRRRAD